MFLSYSLVNYLRKYLDGKYILFSFTLSTSNYNTLKTINMKTYSYKGYTITKYLTGWYSVQTGRYGILKADTLSGIKKMINHAAKAPAYY